MSRSRIWKRVEGKRFRYNEMKHRRDAGFSLAALIFFVTAVSILLGAAVPAYQMQARREREEELIFRGQEYTRAIQKYQRKFGIYPPSIDALVQTNGLRFVRRLYTDPITGKDFRLISINPDGSISGSTLFSQRAQQRSAFWRGRSGFRTVNPTQILDDNPRAESSADKILSSHVAHSAECRQSGRHAGLHVPPPDQR